jgi:hypothetical protein
MIKRSEGSAVQYETAAEAYRDLEQAASPDFSHVFPGKSCLEEPTFVPADPESKGGVEATVWLVRRT